MKNKQATDNPKVVVLISITSDIGTALAARYAADGFTIVGTYRSTNQLDQLRDITDCHLFYCDIADKDSICQFVEDYAALGWTWDTFISCPCNLLPIKPFFDCDFDWWTDSVHINAIEQLRVLHKLHPYRSRKQTANVVFFAGGGTNNAVINFSAYTISKIMLIKMCEFLDAENEDLNIFIVGPGWTKTKSHSLVLNTLEPTDPKYQETLDFMENKQGTSMDDIYGCIKWLSRQGKEVAGGRNFSVVHDKWKGDLSARLSAELKSDINMYKLKRYGNEWRSTGQ